MTQILDDLDCPVELMQAQQARGGQVSTGNSDDLYSYRRGDIPIFNFDDADRILIATLQELIEALRKLKEETKFQKTETIMLRTALQVFFNGPCSKVFHLATKILFRNVKPVKSSVPSAPTFPLPVSPASIAETLLTALSAAPARQASRATDGSASATRALLNPATTECSVSSALTPLTTGAVPAPQATEAMVSSVCLTLARRGPRPVSRFVCIYLSNELALK